MDKPIFDVTDPVVDPSGFAVEVNESLDYIEFGMTTVEGYIDTKIYFDEMLNEGNYLNDLQSYEDRILEYYNTQYSLSETILSDGIINNLSAKELEVLTIPLTNAVVYPPHNVIVIGYYNEFRGDRTNAEVYNDLKAYLLPLQQGISRILATAAGQVFTSGTDAYNDLVAWSETFKADMIAAISSDIDLSAKLTDAHNIDASLGIKITDGTTLKDILITKIDEATVLNSSFTTNIDDATTIRDLLVATNNTAQTTLTDLNDAIDAGDLANYIANTDVVDTLTSVLTDKPLSANQGTVLKGLIDNINLLLTSDDTTLDDLQELVDYIKANKTTLDSLSIASIAGLQTALDGKIATTAIGVTVQAYSANLDIADRIDKVIQTKNITGMTYSGGSTSDKLSTIAYTDSYTEDLFYNVSDKLEFIDHKLSGTVVGYTTLIYISDKLSAYTYTAGVR